MVISIIVFIVIQLFYNSHKIALDGPEADEYVMYLEEKYGKDEGFYIVEEKTCSWFETGVCYKWFSSKKMNGEVFSVYAKRDSTNNRGCVFIDEYESVLNKK